MKTAKKGVIVTLVCISLLSLCAANVAAQQKAAEQKIVLRVQSAFAAVLPALGESLPFFKE